VDAEVDVVVVSYNSREQLRGCVASLSQAPGIAVFVADNASPDRGVETVTDLDVTVLRLERNGGFSYGCNHGWRVGRARYVLFLNPDARIDPGAVRRLAAVLDAEPDVGIVAPRILGEDGAVAHSQRRFPRASTSFARALFLHRLLPRAAWAGEVVRDPSAYAAPGAPDWVSGACMLVRRSILERLDGFDEGFFLYCEDKDLCLRVRRAGLTVRYEPGATAVHQGGASAPRPALAGVLAASRVRYARKHRGRAGAAVERAGLALLALTHLAVSRGGRAARAGHLSSLRVAAGGRVGR
jgi:GT2 family glycosyltransferase